MFKPSPLRVFMIVLMVSAAACAPLGMTATPNPNLINTLVAQTLAVIQTQSAQPGAQPTATFTPAPPTASPTITLTPTPEFTATPSVPLISVSVATNCRVGPGKAYDRVGALLVGEVTEVYGRDALGNYWYVANPDVEGGFCWLWGEYATLVGNIQALPVFTPPPTPTPAPDFAAEYTGLEACTGSGWWVEFKLQNTGGIVFRSISMSVQDTDAKITLSLSDNNFTNRNGCTDIDAKKALGLGEKLTVSSPVFNYDPGGHKFRATLTLCSEDGVNGMCVTHNIEFKP
ncbi:MAG: hypothetical protein AB1509_01925 [Chloroflexota bacterium]